MNLCKNLQKLLKIQSSISNDPDFKLFILNQVFVEVIVEKQPGVTFLGTFCKSNSLKRSC